MASITDVRQIDSFESVGNVAFDFLLHTLFSSVYTSSILDSASFLSLDKHQITKIVFLMFKHEIFLRWRLHDIELMHMFDLIGNHINSLIIKHVYSLLRGCSQRSLNFISNNMKIWISWTYSR
jgi:hypothetical protein